ncbi:MAG: DEAD/DEAH box helicase [Gammaproteobacteria bacterium]
MSSENVSSFSKLGLSDPVMKALHSIGYEQPTPIQRIGIPAMISGRDVLGTAQTGTGKTAAFALPVLSQMQGGSREPCALVLVPTRELAIQVAQAFESYARYVPAFRVLALYGGQDMSKQLKQLRRGVDVVVGTPGRVMDHLRRTTLSLNGLSTVILDEADEMLRMGFIDDVSWILTQTPDEKQVALFSATMPSPIRRVADKHLRQPVEVTIEPEISKSQSIEQFYWLARGTGKLDALSRFLEVEEGDGVIIFVRTKNLTVELADNLERRGYRAAAINGDMNQALRERTIEQLKCGKIDLLIATDVAARGIDVARISHVINYDVPHDVESYVHRIGRTGRAGRQGKAILFVSPREKNLLKRLERVTNGRIVAMNLPTRDMVNTRRIQQYKNRITSALDVPMEPFFKTLVKEIIAEKGCDAETLAVALAHLAQRDNPVCLPAERVPAKHSSTLVEANASSTIPSHRSDKKKRSPMNNAPNTGETVTMERFRLGVGKRHQVRPSDIVGAIANEVDIDSRYIGQIILHDDHSTVDLPEGMPEEVFEQLKRTYVRQNKLQIERMGKGSKLVLRQQRMMSKRRRNIAPQQRRVDRAIT